MVQVPDKLVLDNKMLWARVGKAHDIFRDTTAGDPGSPICMCRNHAKYMPPALLNRLDLEFLLRTENMTWHGARTRAEWLGFASLSADSFGYETYEASKTI